MKSGDLSRRTSRRRATSRDRISRARDALRGAIAALELAVEALDRLRPQPARPIDETADRFVLAWCADDLPVPLVAASTVDLYTALRAWAAERGLRAPPQRELARALYARGFEIGPRHLVIAGARTQRRVAVPPGRRRPPGAGAQQLGHETEEFSRALAAWPGGAGAAPGGGVM